MLVQLIEVVVEAEVEVIHITLIDMIVMDIVTEIEAEVEAEIVIVITHTVEVITILLPVIEDIKFCWNIVKMFVSIYTYENNVVFAENEKGITEHAILDETASSSLNTSPLLVVDFH